MPPCDTITSLSKLKHQIGAKDKFLLHNNLLNYAIITASGKTFGLVRMQTHLQPIQKPEQQAAEYQAPAEETSQL